MKDEKGNSGDHNSGYRNSGDYNSGYYNGGDRNSGDYNSGYRNSGDYNSGDYNSGDYNSGDYNSGSFNTGVPILRLFNKDTEYKVGDIIIPYINLPTNRWVDSSKLTDEQKKADPDFHTRGGSLITVEYKEAWRVAWGEASEELKEKFTSLPNFDPEIFLEITGIALTKKEQTCDGKVVVIDGKEYKLTEV